MIIYPDIELMDGKCVNLTFGRFEEPVSYDADPVEKAKEFASQGAQFIHVCDLDGVMQGGRHNADLICKIIDAVDIPVQVAGGIRTVANVEWWIEHGAGRIVIGTAGIEDPPLLERVCAMFPGRIVGAIDGRDGMVVVNGWRETTAFTALQVARSMEEKGVSAVIFTDIDRDDDLPESSLATTAELARQLSVDVISSGTVKTLDDISTLKYLPNIAGAIVGRALFRGTFTLAEANEICL